MTTDKKLPVSKSPQVTSKRSEHLGPALEMYVRGSTEREISDTLGIPKPTVKNTLQSFRADYLSTLSVREILPRYKDHKDVIDELNQPFYDLLSPSDCPLTNEEMLYSALYVSTGNSLQAVLDSGLDVGLTVTERITKEVFDKNCLLRSEILKRKRNIQEEIRRLQLERVEMIEVTRDHLLAMHMGMIDSLREEGDPKDKSLIVKLLDQVAKMTGSYTTVIKTSEISADDVLDGMKLIMDSELPPELQLENVSERHSNE